jgi:hypothetical protein
MRKGTNDLTFFGKRDYLGKCFLLICVKSQVDMDQSIENFIYHISYHTSDTKELLFCKAAFYNIFEISNRTFDRCAHEVTLGLNLLN